MPQLIDRERFRVAYRQAVGDVTGLLTREQQARFARHDLSLHPDKHDLGVYLCASERRYLELVDLVNAHGRFGREQLRALEVGGFLGAYPLTLARMDLEVTLVEQYGYYYGALDPLAELLEREGVVVWDADFTAPLPQPSPATYTLISNMAMLEHLASSPKALMDNIRACADERATLIVEIPNVAYWPNRLEVLRGKSLHQPLELVYASAPPYLGHHREYTVDELRELLAWSGFQLQELRLFNYSLSLSRGSWLDRLYTLLVYLWPTLIFPACREIIMAAAYPVTPRPPSEALSLLVRP